MILEIPACSAGPTAKLSMLNPLLANNPAILVRTPDSSYTNTDNVCFIIMFYQIFKLIVMK